ncbi:MATE family efflux transporter [uncultured Ilyobacter sp.]|uniref:MATE family efflux transporter n=1 Tax=uncultured Ilyobacter sp. TaxID=544433 RepID=UPI0029C0354F|nr:MATE family efflux transporter [uncultured Ilyobacter sp.]
MEKIKNGNVSKLFLRYLIPSVTGTLSIGILIFIDTIFIGRGIGSLGLVALNTIIPAYTLYSSTGMLLGIGGATAASVDAGRGDYKRRNKIFTHSVILALILGCLYIIGQTLFLEKISFFLGARGAAIPMTEDYLGILSKFTLFYLLPHCLNAFIRNDGNPSVSMLGMVLCGIVNIILDYIFIFEFQWGMKGAALATGIAQTIYTAVLLTHFISKKNSLALQSPKLETAIIQRIAKVGLPSFINEMSFGAVVFAFNYVFLRIGGDTAVAAYSIILNINILLYLVFLGVSQASQPLFSVNYGGGLHKRVWETLKLSTLVSGLLGVVTILVTILYTKEIVGLFIRDDVDLMKVTGEGMPIFFSASVFMALNIILSTFYQSIESSAVSSFITTMRSCVLMVAGLIFLPAVSGIKGVWMTPLFAEGISFLISLYFLKNYFDKNRGSFEPPINGVPVYNK